jgi:hypothetical protein
MKPLSLHDIKNSNVDDFSIIKDNDKENCYILKQNNFSKIEIKFDKKDEEILDTFRILCDNICYSIEKNEDVNVLNVINPIKNDNERKNLLVSISSKTIIKKY